MTTKRLKEDVEELIRKYEDETDEYSTPDTYNLNKGRLEMLKLILEALEEDM